MRRILFYCFFFFYGIAELQSAHIVGGDISYQFVRREGNFNHYRVKMRLYRDRFPVGTNVARSFDPDSWLGLYRGDSLIDFEGNPTLFAASGRPTVETEVANPTYDCLQPTGIIGVNEGIFDMYMVVPVSNQSYFLAYRRCCRNATISNILTPGNVGATFFIEISPEAQRLNSSSPSFDNLPPTLVCLDQPLNVSSRATDPDGDVLVYELCSAIQGANTNGSNGFEPFQRPPLDNVIYRTPDYTFNRPLGAGAFGINPTTGRLFGTPNVQGQFVVTICVKEFRDGVLLSTIRRDFQLNVMPCRPDFAANVQSDSSNRKRFFLQTCRFDSLQLVNLSTGQSRVTNFHWDIALNPRDTTTTRYDVWSPKIPLRDTGLIRGRLFLTAGATTGCSDSLELEVRVLPNPTVDFAVRYDTCSFAPVSVADASRSAGGRIVRWDWTVDGRDTTVANGLTYQYAAPGDKTIRLRVEDARGCRGDTTQRFRWFPAPPIVVIDPSNYVGCVPANLSFRNLSSPIDTTYRVTWTFGDGTPPVSTLRPTHRYDSVGVYSIRIDIVSPIGCRVTRLFRDWIEVRDVPKANFTFSPEKGTNFDSRISFNNLSTKAGAAQWFFSSKNYRGFTTDISPSFTFRDTGLVRAKLVAINAQTGCRDTLEKVVDIEPITTFYLPNAFSPNGDGNNDVLKGAGYLEGIRDFELLVWNRWGEQVFETRDPKTGWNGTKNNGDDTLPQGIYTYKLRFVEPRGREQSQQGYITLIR